MDNITHILCVKIWSNRMKIVTTNSTTENVIKDRICNNKILGIKWCLKKWDNKINNMILGDLIYNNSDENMTDQFIYKETEHLIKVIEKELKENKILSLEQEIIFAIISPIKKEIKKKGSIDSLFRMSFCEEKNLNLMRKYL